MAEVTFIIGDDAAEVHAGDPFQVLVTITEVAGTLQVKLDVISGFIGDLSGFFFNISDTFSANELALLQSLTVTAAAGTDVNDFTIDDDGDADPFEVDGSPSPPDANITNLGFQAGLDIGTVGGAEIVNNATFVIASTSGPIDLSLLAAQQLGIRIQSVGDDNEGSSKLTGYVPEVPDEKPGKITGEKYIDNDASGNFTTGDVIKSGWSVSLYNDVNGDGKYDAGDTLVTSTTTNASGTYTFDGLDPGKYVVVESTPAGWYTKANAEYGVTLTSGDTYGDSYGEKTDFFNYQKACLSGYKYNDKNADGCRDKDGKDNKIGTYDDEVGLSGWTIQLFKDGVFTGKTAVTDANGYYKFANLDPGNYSTKEVLKSGWVQTDPSSPEKLTSGEWDKYGNDFGNFLPKPKIDLDKQVYSVTGGYKDKYGEWVADSAGDVINYKFVLKNAGNVALKNVVLKDYFESSAAVTLTTKTGDANSNNILDVGETWTYSLKHTVTQAELNAARKIVTEVQKIGFFTCYVKKCTGDLELDNYAKVTANAYIPYTDKVVKLTDSDFETVNVNCPTGCVDGNASTYGGSTAENLWQNYQHASA